jgi:LPXTG-site transpeptidase (sortase) family protein
MSYESEPGSGSPLSRLLDRVRSGRAPLPVIGGVAAIVVIGIIVVVVALGSGGGDDGTSESPGLSGGLQTTTPVVEATIDLDRPTGEAAHLNAIGPNDRFVIRGVGVEAPMTYRKVGLDGVMPNPEGPDDIVYYDFSEWPGMGGAPNLGGNTVVSGHVDSGRVACKNGTVPPPCPAVLWDLNTMKLGDEIQLVINGETFKYAVTSNQPVPASGGPWDQIVSSTQEETLTIITCGGDFNRATGEYTNRQVVTAVRTA